MVRRTVKALSVWILVVAGLAVCPIAGALDVKTYLRGKNASEQRQFLYYKIHLKNVVEDLGLENKNLEAAGRPPLFCLPSNLRLDHEEILKILDDEIKLPSTRPEDGTEALLLQGLRKRFPCK